MLATFDDFIRHNPVCKKFEHDNDMQNVFEFLSQSYVLIQLIDASEAKKPAITPVVTNIEHFFDDPNKEHLNTLDDSFTKQAVGLMIKTILEPFGYEVWKQMNLSKNIGATKFVSASSYKFNPIASRTMKVEKRIVEIDSENTTNRQEMGK
ncbi:MAG: hypothetical protein LBD23_00270 [Oscillospiraceae bacterium]|jgi:hypothetical protein|nr:hypothetical protein [Oscillospiraceae bacterium]